MPPLPPVGGVRQDAAIPHPALCGHGGPPVWAARCGRRLRRQSAGFGAQGGGAGGVGPRIGRRYSVGRVAVAPRPSAGGPAGGRDAGGRHGGRVRARMARKKPPGA